MKKWFACFTVGYCSLLLYKITVCAQNKRVTGVVKALPVIRAKIALQFLLAFSLESSLNERQVKLAQEHVGFFNRVIQNRVMLARSFPYLNYKLT